MSRQSTTEIISTLRRTDGHRITLNECRIAARRLAQQQTVIDAVQKLRDTHEWVDADELDIALAKLDQP